MKFKVLFFLFLTSTFYAQLSFDKNNDTKNFTYSLTDIIITGGTNEYNKDQILQLAGLNLNENIDINGSKIKFAMRKLWESYLFSDVQIFIHSIINNTSLILRIHLIPLPNLGKINIKGISKEKSRKFKKDLGIKEGIKINKNLKYKFQKNIIDYYKNNGFIDIKIDFLEEIIKDSHEINWNIFIHKGDPLKINSIKFEGNNNLSNKRLRSKFKNIKSFSIFNIFNFSKFNFEKFNKSLTLIINEYQSLGFRDVKITNYSIDRTNKKNQTITIYIDEGKRYYIGNIKFIGNIKYSDNILNQILNYKSGDIYNQIDISNKISNSKNNNDIASFYTNNGYIHSNIYLIEKCIHNNTIDIDIIIDEGVQATWNKISFSGNYTTYDHIIQRSLKTLPGDFFSSENIKRTYFDLASMPYIEVQGLKHNIVTNRENNTVNIHWKIKEKNASQVQLQGGYGENNFIGSLGLSFNNFSLRNLLKKNKWNPIPTGDGQILSLQAQIGGNNFQNYSITFTEPWISGSTPTALSISSYFTILSRLKELHNNTKLNTFGSSITLNKLLTWPDDWFRLSNTLTFQIYNFTNSPFTFGNIQINNSSSNNLNYTISLSRNSQGIDPIFPTSGSEFDISIKITPPYSFFYKQNYDTNYFKNIHYKWIEYYKIKMKSYWYQEFFMKSVLLIGGEFGMLKKYNRNLTIPPFERFFLGGTGTGNRSDSKEIISLRGYQNATHNGGNVNKDITPYGGGIIYNKFIIELRYPITMKQNLKSYGLFFLEAGNTWESIKKYQPFQLKRAAGIGIRIFIPTLGLIGFDCGYGFDNLIYSNEKSKWKTHLILGQQF